MQIYDAITNMTTTLGLTFDEAFTYMLFFALAFVGGWGFMISMCLDLGGALYRAVRWLLRAMLRLIRRLWRVRFWK